MGVYFVNGATTTQREIFQFALTYLEKSPAAQQLLNKIANDTLLVRINYNGDTLFDNNNGTLYWDPTKAHKIISEDGSIQVTSPALALIHEILHWSTPEQGSLDEMQAKEFERGVARELGEPVRVRGTGVDTLGSIVVDNSTAHTKSGKWVAVDKNQTEFTGPAFDPDNSTIVIGTNEENPVGGSGGEESGGGGWGGSGSGGTSTGGGGTGTGVVVVQPPPKPPEIDNPEIIFNPTSEFEIEIVGVQDVPFF